MHQQPVCRQYLEDKQRVAGTARLKQPFLDKQVSKCPVVDPSHAAGVGASRAAPVLAAWLQAARILEACRGLQGTPRLKAAFSWQISAAGMDTSLPWLLAARSRQACCAACAEQVERGELGRCRSHAAAERTHRVSQALKAAAHAVHAGVAARTIIL